jgi:hypothetical protein
MQTNVLAEISSQQDSDQTERFAREWAATFAELFCVSLADRGPRFVNLWVSALSDLDPHVLDAACKRATQTCKFFPTPAEIRAHVDRADAAGLHLRAEEAWQDLLEWIRKFYGPDLGVSRIATELPAPVTHALRAAGGLHWIWGCPESDLQWAKKRFVEDFVRVHETHQVEFLLTDGEARKILRRVAGAVERLQLSPHADPVAESNYKPTVDEVRAAKHATLDRVRDPRPPEERSAAAQKKRLLEWASKHPEIRVGSIQ